MLLGLNMEKIKVDDRAALWYLLITARIKFAKYWRQERIPKIEEWQQSIIQLIEMDKLTRKLREEESERHKRNWKKKKYIYIFKNGM